MIIVKIYGGLGNQMFQYAFARSLSLEYNKKFTLDISWFKKQIDTTDLDQPDKREYLLNNFDIVERYSPSIVSTFIWLVSKITSKFKVLDNISKFFLLNKYWPINITESEYNQFDDNNLISRKKLILLNGYWQDFKYFEKYKDIIRKEFTLKSKLKDENEEYLKNIVSSNSISIHFRRGDYLKTYAFKFYSTCSMDYYLNSISYISTKVHNPTFFIFSDDIEWVKSNFKIDYPVVFINNLAPDYEHLFLMSQCKHNIIANSTFSWWGAWLNSNPVKIVIAPQKWTVDDNDYHAKIPESWLRFKNMGNE